MKGLNLKLCVQSKEHIVQGQCFKFEIFFGESVTNKEPVINCWSSFNCAKSVTSAQMLAAYLTCNTSHDSCKLCCRYRSKLNGNLLLLHCCYCCYYYGMCLLCLPEQGLFIIYQRNWWEARSNRMGQSDAVCEPNGRIYQCSRYVCFGCVVVSTWWLLFGLISPALMTFFAYQHFPGIYGALLL